MEDRGRIVRNAAILVVLAAVVWRVPGGDVGGLVVAKVISLVFWGGLLFLAYRLYMERRTWLFGWDDRIRLRLYGSVALIMLLIVGLVQMFAYGGLGALTWVALLALAIWGVFTSFRAARAY